MIITDLLDTIYKYQIKRNSYRLRRKFKRLDLNKYVKKQNVTKNDLNEATRLNNKLLDDLQKVAKLRRIKNIDDMSKEGLIYKLLRSEKNILEENYIKYMAHIINYTQE